MDLPNLARDLDKLATADAIVADSYLRYIFRKGALYVLACVLATISLVLLGLALYWLLEQSTGRIGATALIAVVGFLVAGIIAVLAILQRPGHDHSIAMEMRRSSISTLEQNISTPTSGAAFMYPAGEALISSIILPLVAILIKSLKSSHAAKVTESATELVETNATLPPDVAPKG